MENIEFAVKSRPQKEWGTLVIQYHFFTGFGAGLVIFALMLGSFYHLLIGAVSVALGVVFLRAELGNPKLAWRAIMRPQTAWISRGTIGIAIFFGLSAVLVALHILVSGEQNGSSLAHMNTMSGASLILSSLLIIASLFVTAYPGFLLRRMRAIPLWDTAVLPPLYLVSGVLSGLGIFYLILFEQNVITMMNGAALLGAIALLILQGILLIAFNMSSNAITKLDAENLFRKGLFRIYFDMGVIGFGTLAPLAILASIYSGIASAKLLPLVGILLVSGALLLKHIIIKAGVKRTTI